MLKSLTWSLVQGKCSYGVSIVLTVTVDSEQSMWCSDAHLCWKRASTLCLEMAAIGGGWQMYSPDG